MKKERGITLISLVVTIIILLILAGVTINAALSQNGLFKRAKDAGEKYREEEAKENGILSGYGSEIDKVIAENEGKLVIGNEKWDKETRTAKVKITSREELSEEMKIQYLVSKNGEEVDIEKGEWTEGQEVSNLNHNDVVYARIYDGEKGSSNISKKIEDRIEPKVEIETQVEEKKVTVRIKGEDNETGLTSYEVYIDGEKVGEKTENVNNEEIIEVTTDFGNRKCYVIAKDKVGNNGKSEEKDIKITGEVALYSNGKVNEDIVGKFNVFYESIMSYVDPWEEDHSNHATIDYGEDAINIKFARDFYWTEGGDTRIGGGTWRINLVSEKLIKSFNNLSKARIRFSWNFQNGGYSWTNLALAQYANEENKVVKWNSICYESAGQDYNLQPVNSGEKTMDIDLSTLRGDFKFGIGAALCNTSTLNEFKIYELSLIYE